MTMSSHMYAHTVGAKTLHFLITPTEQYVIQVTDKSDGMSMF